MTVVECDGCERDVITSNPESESYCPDCADPRRRSKGNHQRQAAAVKADYRRQRVIDNAVNQGGSL